MTKSGPDFLFRCPAGSGSKVNQALNGVLLWHSHANAQGGISIDGDIPRAVRLIWYDDGSQISRTRENVLLLIRDYNLDILEHHHRLPAAAEYDGGHPSQGGGLAVGISTRKITNEN